MCSYMVGPSTQAGTWKISGQRVSKAAEVKLAPGLVHMETEGTSRQGTRHGAHPVKHTEVQCTPWQSTPRASAHPGRVHPSGVHPSGEHRGPVHILAEHTEA